MMDIIDEPSYQNLRAGARVLEADGFGDKVLLLGDGNILKLFRRKRLLSSALWSPYARRFATNAQRLTRIQVPVPEVLQLMRISSIARDAVLYRPLPGESLRQLSTQELPEARLQAIRQQLDALVRHLCVNGLYFRSLHAGNVILTPEDTLGLIDFADMRAYPWPLGQSAYQRMLKPMLKTDAHWVSG